MSTDPVVACALGPADLAEQARRWTELRRRAEVGQLATRTGKRVRFRADEGVAAELEELVALESRCCSWADWSIERARGELVLDVTSTGHGVDVLHTMFRPAGPRAPRRPR